MSKVATELLEVFCTKHKPTKQYISDGRGYAETIFDLLRRKSSYKLNRALASATIGKRSNLGGHDFDIYVFVNEIVPPYTAIIESFKVHLLSALTDLKVESIEELYMSFTFKDYKYHLHPAVNFFDATSSELTKKRNQIHHMLDEIAKLPSPETEWPYYSSCLAEFHVGFLRVQSEFVHNVIILAKHWDKLLDADFQRAGITIQGRPVLIELIAIKAGKKVRRKMIFPIFKRFLTMMAEFETLDVFFNDYGYAEEKIPTNVGTLPKVMDPANPWNNLAKRVPPGAVSIYKSRAVQFMSRLEKLGPAFTPDELFQPPNDNDNMVNGNNV